MTEEQFQAERRTGIGGSDVVHLFNIPPYGCQRRLWYDKRGTEPDYPTILNQDMRRGRKIEPLAAEEFTLRTGIRLVEKPILRHPKHQWAMVHVDRMTVDGKSVVEIKCPRRDTYFKAQREGPPPDYVLQVQHGMMVDGQADEGILVVHCADLWEQYHVKFPRITDIWHKIIETGDEFWPMVTSNSTEPARLSPDSPQCHNCPWSLTCQGQEMAQRAEEHQRGKKDKAPADESLAPLVAEYVAARGILTEAEASLEGIKEELKTAMKERPAIVCSAGTVYHRAHSVTRTNTDKVRAFVRRMFGKVDYNGDWIEPEVYDMGPVSVTSTEQPLRVYPAKEKHGRS